MRPIASWDNLMRAFHQAAAVLANTATALADTKTARGQASMDPETAIAELERLAKRIGKYALSTTSGA